MDIHVAMLHFLQSKKTLQFAGSNLSFFSAIKRYVKFRKHNFFTITMTVAVVRRVPEKMITPTFTYLTGTALTMAVFETL